MPVYPGDPPFTLTRVATLAAGAPGATPVNVSRMELGLHSGTHLDAPLHFRAEGAAIDAVTLEAACGPCLLVDVADKPPRAAIGAADLTPHAPALRRLQRVVLRTGWSRHWREAVYFTSHPVVGEDAARLLADCGVRLVGVDMPSVDAPPHPAHQVLLSRGVLILENLTRLEALPRGRFMLAALPLRIVQGEASPVRAVAWVEQPPGATARS